MQGRWTWLRSLGGARADASKGADEVFAGSRLYPGTRCFWEAWKRDQTFLAFLIGLLFKGVGVVARRVFRIDGSRLRWPVPERPLGRLLDASVPIFVGLCLLGLVLSLLDPFGLARASKAQSERLSARLLAPFYYSEAQSKIAVVLIDDEALARSGMAWPLRYSEYETLVRRVLAHSPRAVYLDVLLEQARSYDDSLEAARHDLHAEVSASGTGGAATPVYFGVAAPGRTSIFSQPGGVRDVVTGWQGLGDDYPLRFAKHQAYLGASRPMDAALEAGDPAYRSVALALYQAACGSPDAEGCAQSAARLDDTARRHMRVQWGAMQPLVTPAHRLSDCVRTEHPGIAERAKLMAALAWDSLRSGVNAGSEDRGRVRCPHTLTLHMDQLTDSRLLRQDETTPGLLEDRVVLIGTYLLGLDDRVMSPVNQQIPGVYLHAMAVDNLMTWGSRRVHSIPGLGFALDVATMVLMSLACACVLLWGRPRWALPLLLCAAPAVVGVALLMVAQYVLRQPPQDWLGLAGLAVAMGLYVHRRVSQSAPATREGADENEHDNPRLRVPGNGLADVAGDGERRD